MGCKKLSTNYYEKPRLRVVKGSRTLFETQVGNFQKDSRRNLKSSVDTVVYYYGARYYNPKVSNWLSVDPLAVNGKHLDGLSNTGGVYHSMNNNPYSYVHNKPTIAVDPNGKDIYKLTKTGILILHKRTNDKFVTFIDHKGKQIFRTDTNKNIHENMEQFSTPMEYFEAVSDVGVALEDQGKVRGDIRKRAKQKGFDSSLYEGGVDEFLNKSEGAKDNAKQQGWFDLITSLFSGQGGKPGKGGVFNAVWKILTGEDPAKSATKKIEERKEQAREQMNSKRNVFQEIKEAFENAKAPNTTD